MTTAGGRSTGVGELPPAAGGAVMATAVLSVGMHLVGAETVSRVLLGLAAALWLLLAGVFLSRLVSDRRRWVREADTPAALTGVAATAVLGVRCHALGWQAVPEVLLALAFALWPGLLVSVLRHGGRRVPGAVFLVSVATEALAVLAADLGGAVWRVLPWAAAVLWLLGLALYVEAFARFDVAQVVDGRGDQWIAAGALAAGALAADKLWSASSGPAAGRSGLYDAMLVLLVLALLGYAVLAAAEVVRPRLTYDVARWATVFPMAMTAATALSVGTTVRAPWLSALGCVLLAAATAAWLLTTYGAARRRLRRQPAGTPADPGAPR
ncbi:SLAC1 family transporter [Streptomyces antimicrobicus]|uniref:Integral membrane protein n=1 Tax=Streptomyces antimicrobicus TaxID=2883108 RepID=A0ABS8BF91_9ACTN|nr:hypothetical protein [Streptomyces antimicrobicus]MCB5183296.1 hypothetical protein [Streptomyces antimicrobicus]